MSTRVSSWADGGNIPSASSLTGISDAMKHRRGFIQLLIFLCGVAVTIFFYQVPYLRESFNRDCIDWSKISADSMTARQIVEYLKWTNHSSCQISHYFGGNYGSVSLLFSPGMDGQKAVCVDFQVEPVSEACIVYSFGISNEWSFDEAMQKYGCYVFAFDPSMNKEDHLHSKRIHFYNLGLGYEDAVRSNGWNMKTLSSIYKMLKPKHGDMIIDYLKIDIEGDEWSVIENIITSGMLSKIRQMGVEIHMWPVNATTINYHRNLIKTLQRLEANGMVRFSSLINPTSSKYVEAFGFNDFTCYEIAWYNSYLYDNSTPVKDGIKGRVIEE